MEQENPGKYELTDQDKVFIDIEIKTIEDLFNKFDQNTPDNTPKLNQEFVETIIDGAREAGESEIIIRVKLPNLPGEKMNNNIENDLRLNFNNLKDSENRSIEKMFGRFFKLFGFGAVFLFIAIVFNRYFDTSDGFISQIFYEGLTIAGWISLWAAIVTVIVKWPPQKENVKLYEKLMKTQIIFRN